MPYKDPEVRRLKSRGYSAKYYEKNKEVSRERTTRSKARYRREWREFKAQFSCVGCGLTGFPDLLDFHHLPRYRDSEDKMSVNRLLANCRFTRAREETAKCVPLCSNCHRLGHQMEREGWPVELGGVLAALRSYFLDRDEYLALVATKSRGAGS